MASVTVKKLPMGASRQHTPKGDPMVRRAGRRPAWLKKHSPEALAAFRAEREGKPASRTPSWFGNARTQEPIVWMTAEEVGTYEPDDADD